MPTRAGGAGATAPGRVASGADGLAPGEYGDLERIIRWYREAGRAMRAGDPFQWGAGLTMPQLRVLYFVGRGDPVSVSEVAAEIGVTQPSATESLDRLVRAGLIEQAVDPNDRRVIRNAVTPAGRNLIDRPWETRRAVLTAALEGLPPHERETIGRGLHLLWMALGCDQAPPPPDPL